MMRYNVDIDGTICYPGEGDGRYTDAVPRWDRIKIINKLHDEGHEIIYHTARGMGTFKNDREAARKEYYVFTINQLNSWGCKYDALFLGKPAADFYIDDKGIQSDKFFDQYYFRS